MSRRGRLLAWASISSKVCTSVAGRSRSSLAIWSRTRIRETLRIGIGPNQQIHPAPRKLCEREIQFRLRINGKADIFNVPNHGDDLSRNGSPSYLDMLPNRVLVWKNPSRKAFVGFAACRNAERLVCERCNA